MVRKFNKVISILLVAAMLAFVFPMQIFATENIGEKTDTDIEEKMETANYAESNIVGEVESKREINIKHFLKEDGSYEAVTYPCAVHYEYNGEWKDIDNTLIEGKDDKDNPVYENKDNNIKLKVSKNTNSDKLVRMTKDKYEVSWNLCDIEKTEGNIKIKDEKAKELLSENEKQKTLDKLTSTLIYEEVYENVDLNLIFFSEGIKDNIVIKDKIDSYIFKYEFELKNLKAEIKDTNIIFYDENNPKDIIFIMEVPYMFDAGGASSSNISLKLEETSKGYSLLIFPDEDWVKNEKREYPITIDPIATTNIDKEYIYDCHAMESYPDTNQYNGMVLKVGNFPVSQDENRAYINFELPPLNSGDMVISAQLDLYNYEAQVPGNQQINAYEVTESWESTDITWNNQPSSDTRVLDYEEVVECDANTQHSWDVTGIVKKWQTLGYNYGLLLKNAPGETEFVEFWSSDVSSTYELVRPCINIFYVNNTGLEGFWTYHDQNVGRAGTGYVNDYNGNLVFVHNDISMSGNRMPIAISHVYNSNDKDKDIGFGKGWRLNLSQEVKAITIGDNDYYRYIDEDGTCIYFLKEGTAPYKDEMGTGLEITEDLGSTTARYVIKDKGENMLIFDSEGKLNKIKDTNDNEMILTYTGNLLTKVTDGVGRVVNLTYDVDNHLESIKDPSNRTITYTYNTYNRMKTIMYPDGKYSEYWYSYNLLLWAKNVDGYKMTYSYSSSKPYRVLKIAESSIDENQNIINGGELTLEYGDNITTFTDVDGNKSIYQFNNSGNTINIQNDNGYAQYYEFLESGNNRNSLSSISKLQNTVINKLKNHNAEKEDGWTFESIENSSATGEFTTEEKYMAQKSLKISKTNYLNESSYKQSLSLNKGRTYTLSGYISTSGITSDNGKGANLEVTVTDSYGNNQIFVSEYVTGSHDWERYDVTFDLPSDAVSNVVTVKCAITEEIGTAYFDCMQLEEGSIANRYNLVENPDLYWGIGEATYWIEGNFSNDDQIVAKSNPSKLDSDVYRITGDADTSKYIKQIINIQGSKGDTYTFGAWSIAESVPIKDDRTYHLMVRFDRNDGTRQYVKVPFNTDTNEWQYVSGVAIADSDYSAISICGIYYKNENTAYFDGFQLYKEEFSSSYQYDENGNLVSTENLANQKSTFEFSGSNDLIKATDAKGNSFEYTYDTHHNILKAVTAENVNYSFDYDQFGNPINSKVGGAESGLIAYYSFDEESLHDDSDNGYNGINHGATYVDGHSGKAICFDGTDDWAELTNFSVPESFSISMWVNPEQASSGQCFVGKHKDNGGNIFISGYWANKPYAEIRGYNNNGGVMQTGYYHQVVTVEKISSTESKISIYENGNLVTEGIVDKVIGDTNGKAWCLGQDWDAITTENPTGLSDFFDGQIDELAFYDHTLSLAEVNNLFESPMVIDENDLGILAAYSFDAETLHDDSGNNNDGDDNQSNNYEYIEGHNGKAIKFDGIDDYAELTDFSVPESFSVSMWVNPYKTDGGQCFLGKHTLANENIFLDGYWSSKTNVRIREDNFIEGVTRVGYYSPSCYSRKNRYK